MDEPGERVYVENVLRGACKEGLFQAIQHKYVCILELTQEYSFIETDVPGDNTEEAPVDDDRWDRGIGRSPPVVQQTPTVWTRR